jgi:hypothetical protein
MKLYRRHSSTCKHHKKRNYTNCDCAIWIYDPQAPRNKQRQSAHTNNWDEAMRDAVADRKKRPVAGTEIITECVDLRLVKKSGRAKNADCAPYDMRWLLRDGSRRQPSLLQWAAENGFTKLSEITSEDVDRWRNTWVFREESYSLKNSNARIKAFFTWAVKFEHLDKNPFDRLPAFHNGESDFADALERSGYSGCHQFEAGRFEG